MQWFPRIQAWGGKRGKSGCGSISSQGMTTPSPHCPRSVNGARVKRLRRLETCPTVRTLALFFAPFPSHRGATVLPHHAQHLPSCPPSGRQLGLASLRRPGLSLIGAVPGLRPLHPGAGLATGFSHPLAGLITCCCLVGRSGFRPPSSAHAVALCPGRRCVGLSLFRPQRCASCPWAELVRGPWLSRLTSRLADPAQPPPAPGARPRHPLRAGG